MLLDRLKFLIPIYFIWTVSVVTADLYDLSDLGLSSRRSPTLLNDLVFIKWF